MSEVNGEVLTWTPQSIRGLVDKAMRMKFCDRLSDSDKRLIIQNHAAFRQALFSQSNFQNHSCHNTYKHTLTYILIL